MRHRASRLKRCPVSTARARGEIAATGELSIEEIEDHNRETALIPHIISRRDGQQCY